jgi:hypothetical protein
LVLLRPARVTKKDALLAEFAKPQEKRRFFLQKEAKTSSETTQRAAAGLWAALIRGRKSIPRDRPVGDGIKPGCQRRPGVDHASHRLRHLRGAFVGIADGEQSSFRRLPPFLDAPSPESEIGFLIAEAGIDPGPGESGGDAAGSCASSTVTGVPASARCQAIEAPMIPAPTTMT